MPRDRNGRDHPKQPHPRARKRQQASDGTGQPTEGPRIGRGGIRSIRQPMQTRKQKDLAKEPLGEKVGRLAEDDLLAIADMDPGELAALMEGSISTTRVEVGARITGRVTRIGRDGVFVDIGAKSEGQIAREEVPEVRVGDDVTAFVLSANEYGIRLSQRLAGPAAAVFLDSAQQSGIPVSGKVVGRNPGGFTVKIGGAHAFCPVSLIDRLPSADMDEYVGQTYDFKVLETGEKVVLSRRALQEEELGDDLGARWARLQEGEGHEGVITSVQSWGVFVDIDGVEGLVHRSELGWGDVEDPTTRFRRGQRLAVRVLRVDRDAHKLSLSAKDPAGEPWLKVGKDFLTGGTYPGTVVRIESYGAFVDLAPGLQGLLHVSNTGGRPIPKIGSRVEVQLVSVDAEQRRLELALGESEDAGAGEGDRVKGTVIEVLRNGVLVELADGRTGWLPGREVDLPAGTVLAQRFRRGREITARIIEIDVKRGRPILSAKADASAGDRAWQEHSSQGGEAESFGTLADLLRGFKAD